MEGHARRRRFRLAAAAGLSRPSLQEAEDLAALEGQIGRVTESADFQAWSREVSVMLVQSPKREVYLVL